MGDRAFPVAATPGLERSTRLCHSQC